MGKGQKRSGGKTALAPEVEAQAEVMKQPWAWKEFARRLKRGADLIREAWRRDVAGHLQQCQIHPENGCFASPDKWPNYEIACVYAMLLGLAFENLAKGIYIGTCRPSPTDSKDHLHHGIQRILREASIRISDEEDTVLEKLRTFVMWAGRYPIPMDDKDYGRWSPLSVAEQDQAEQLYIRLNRQLQKIVESNSIG